MITDINCCGGRDGSTSFNQRLKALERAVASYSTAFASKKILAEEADLRRTHIDDLDFLRASGTTANIQYINTSHIDAKDGFGYFGTLVVGKLELTDPEVNVEYNNITSNSIAAEYGDFDHIDAKSINVDILNVKGLMDMFNMKRLFINGKRALTNESTSSDNALTIAEDFRVADFRTSLRPTWQGQPIALQSDTSSVFTLMGIVGDDSELPANPADGSVYFIQRHQDAVLGTVPAVALFENNQWGYVNYPGLDAYLTKQQYSDDQQALSNRLDNDEASIQSVIGSVASLTNEVEEATNKVEELDTDLNEYKGATDERLDTAESDIESLKADKLDDAPQDGQFYGRKDGEWSTIGDSGTFVNSEYKDDDTESSIRNSSNGVVIESTKDMLIPTAKEQRNTTKAAVNVEYLRANLNLSKQAGSSDVSRYKLVPKKTESAQYDYLHYEGYNAFTGIRPVGTSHHYTANYIWQLRRTSNANYNFVGAYDREGTWHDATPASLSNNFALTNSFEHTNLVGFHADQYDSDTEDAVYLPTYGTGRIFAFDKGEYLGMVKEGDNDTPYQLDALQTNWLNHVSGRGLRGARRILLVNSSQTEATKLKAFIIGIDDNLLEGKSITLAGAPWYGVGSVASGKNYWWIQNGTGNQWMRVSKDGGVASFIAQYDGSALPTNLTSSPNNYIELENGDCVFAVNDTANNNTYFVWCSDSDEDTPCVAIRAPVYYASSATSNTLPWAGWYPFIETGNYLYFFQTVGASGTGIEDTDSSYTQNNAKTYTRIDKVSKTVSALTVPWSQGSREYNSYLQRVRTKGGYTWCFPFGASSPSDIQGLCLVFDPNGNAQTVDLGTGSSVNWFQATGFVPYSLKLFGTPSWSNSQEGAILCAVDGKGTGFLIAPDLRHILVFRGNGEYRIFTYTDTDTFVPQGTANSTAVNNQGYHMYLTPMSNGVVLELRATALTSSPASSTESKYVYLSDECTDEAIVEPTATLLSGYESSGWKRSIAFFAHSSQNDYQARGKLLTSILPPMNADNGLYGSVSFVETPVGTTGKTIFLRDGDTTISNVSI